MVLDDGAASPLGTANEQLLEGATRANATMVTRALERGASVDVQNQREATALMLAAVTKAQETSNIVEQLLHARADIHKKDAFGRSVVLYACGAGNAKLVQLLLSRDAFPHMADDHKTVLHLATESKQHALVHALLKRQDVVALLHRATLSGETAMHCAARSASKHIVRDLLNNKAKVQVKDNQLKQPLHVASEHGCLPIVKLLIARSAYIEAKDGRLWTPLMCAVQFGHNRLALFLMEKWANPNARDADGWSPVDAASRAGMSAFCRQVAQNKWEQDMEQLAYEKDNADAVASARGKGAVSRKSEPGSPKSPKSARKSEPGSPKAPKSARSSAWTKSPGSPKARSKP